MNQLNYAASDFPPVPEIRGEWRPIYLEPIYSSGERFTVAIVVTVRNKAIIKSVIRPEVLRGLYGAKAPNMKGLVELCVESFSAHLNAQQSPKSWTPPITGVTFGEEREAAADSIDGILEQAIQWSASLSSLEQSTLDVEISENERKGSTKLAEQIRDVVASTRIDLVPYFNKSVKFYSEGEPVRFGFLGVSSAAHFGSIRHRNLASYIKDARGRLWELGKAKKTVELSRTGLILHIPERREGTLTDKQLQSLASAANELFLEAAEADIQLEEIEDIEAGARKVLALAA